MTTTEAIAEETRRYLVACDHVAYHRGPDGSALLERHYRNAAHRHYRALLRLRHRELTEHEALAHRTTDLRHSGYVAA